MKKVYPKSPELVQFFLSTIEDYPGFVLKESGTVSRISIDGDEYYIYLKCISHEGKPYPLEHQRAQLPQRPEFEKVISSTIPFLFLGYDIENLLYVCWEPAKVKPRLNKKSYVSFYSRLSAQQTVEEGKIKCEILTNGDKFVLFKSSDVLSFFQMIDTHFPELKKTEHNYLNEEINPKYGEKSQCGKDIQGKLISIEEDFSVKLLVDTLPDGHPVLDIVAECMNTYGDYYDRMSFSDWTRITKEYLNR